MNSRSLEVFVDTSAWYALADKGEDRYERAQAIMGRVNQGDGPPMTSNFVVAETHALILRRLGRFEAYRFLRSVRGGAVDLVRIEPVDEERAVEIIEGYVDKAFSYADATSFAVMRRLGVATAFSFDRHLAQFGLATLGVDA